MEALGRYLLIKPDPVETETSAGLAVSETPENGNRPPKGEVLSVGPLAFTEYDGIGKVIDKIHKELVGKKVYFKKYAMMAEIGSGDDAVIAVMDDEVICLA